jgi:hypothetical protein
MLSNVCNWLYYLTKPFGVDAFSVRWYAQVRGHELVTRRDLLPEEADHPRADQRYYKLQLGKLVELPHPIPSRSLRRITFILTNGKRLTEAWEINDLCASQYHFKTCSPVVAVRVLVTLWHSATCLPGMLADPFP